MGRIVDNNRNLAGPAAAPRAGTAGILVANIRFSRDSSEVSPRPMRKWILRIHLYGGLLCAPYLMIFGFSSLHFNHHFAFVAPAPNSTEWQAPRTPTPATNNDALAQSVRDSLGLAGWTIPWKMSRDAAGDLQFDLERPGKSYTVHTVANEHKVRVEEHRKGFWQVVNSLHALGSVPNAPFTSWWAIYTEICTGFVAFAAVSGVYLWMNSQRERRIGLVAFLGALIASVGFMVFVILRG